MPDASSSPTPPPRSTRDDAADLDRVIQDLQAVAQAEERTQAALDSQATTLIAVLSIIATLLAGAGGIVLQEASQVPTHWLITVLLASAYGTAGVCLVLALGQTVAVLQAPLPDRPDPADPAIFETDEAAAGDMRRQYLAALRASARTTRTTTTAKAAHLRAAYRHLQRAALSLVLAGGLVLLVVVWALRP